MTAGDEKQARVALEEEAAGVGQRLLLQKVETRAAARRRGSIIV
ncbi:MAG: hypothetical protein ABI423_09525 [Burkholderiales bacterium]